MSEQHFLYLIWCFVCICVYMYVVCLGAALLRLKESSLQTMGIAPYGARYVWVCVHHTWVAKPMGGSKPPSGSKKIRGTLSVVLLPVAKTAIGYKVYQNRNIRELMAEILAVLNCVCIIYT